MQRVMLSCHVSDLAVDDMQNNDGQDARTTIQNNDGQDARTTLITTNN
jgi:hypothetical protein